MQCKACSTRIDPGHSVCPNCGRTTGPTLTAKPAPAAKKAKPAAPGKSGVEGKSGVQSKSGVQNKAAPDGKAATRAAVAKAIDLELDEIADIVDDAHAEASSASHGEHEQQGLGPKPTELRAILAEQPELLEPDLRILSGPKRGVRYPTDVGEIDLLMVDDEKNLVVVSVPDPESPGDLVSEVLQRMGWVRKHVAKGQQDVRGIVLLPPMPEDLSYAAAAVAGTVAFRTYRMSISFDELEF